LTAILTALILIFVPQSNDPRWKVVQPYNTKLERMAECESTSRWFLNTHNGYYGGLQFDLSTWRSVKGKRYPHQNSKLEQKYRAVLLIKKYGYRPWPNCGNV
jgi:Transglycosylase-like domain